MSTAFFRGRGAGAILAAALLSLLFCVLLLVEGDSRSSVETGKQDSYSYSAVGHHAFAELLGELGFAVNRSRVGFTSRRQVQAAWVIAEPQRDAHLDRAVPPLTRVIEDAAEVLLVLPKRVVWGVEPGRDTDQLWVDEEIGSDPGALAAQTLDDALREPPRVLSSSSSGPTRFTAAGGATLNVHVDDLQLMENRFVEPLIWNDDGVLVGRLLEYTQSRVIVLADPDLIATHGLGRADNAAVAVRALRELPASSGLVMFDEIVHGHAFEPSLWVELTSFPLSLVLLQALVATAFLVWAGASRFGAARPPEVQLSAGRRTLIANTAELLLRGGHGTYSLRRYFGRTVETVAETLHLPAEDSPGDNVQRLSQASEGRPRTDDPLAIETEIARLPTAAGVGARRNQARRILRSARRIHHWREEMLHGPTTDPADR